MESGHKSNPKLILLLSAIVDRSVINAGCVYMYMIAMIS